MTSKSSRSGEFLSVVFCILSGITAFNLVGELSHDPANAARDAALTASLATLAAFAPGAGRDFARRRLEGKEEQSLKEGQSLVP